MVSLTDDGTGRHLYAGTVPIYGCDSFELYTEAKAPDAGHGESGDLCTLSEREKGDTWLDDQ